MESAILCMLAPLLCREQFPWDAFRIFASASECSGNKAAKKLLMAWLNVFNVLLVWFMWQVVLYTLFQEIGRKRAEAALREVVAPCIQVGSNI